MVVLVRMMLPPGAPGVGSRQEIQLSKARYSLIGTGPAPIREASFGLSLPHVVETGGGWA